MTKEKIEEINGSNGSSSRSLISAIMKGQDDIAKLLIEKGADLNIESKSGKRALMWAVHKGQDDMVKLFQEAKDLDDKMASGRDGEFIDLNSRLFRKLDF